VLRLHERNYDWFANDLEEPYTTAKDKPFSWQGRMRVTGGRTVVWGRQSYRMGDFDFKAASTDGFGMDWPLSYADLEPYYDRVEDYVGISGLAEGAYELPDSRFQPAMPFKCGERRLRERVKAKLGWTVTMGPRRQPHAHDERPRAVPLLRAVLLGAASPTRTSTRPSRPWPTRSRPATARTCRTRWSTRS
jgi:choline dehydrogenase-like flavoprotein